MAVIDLASRRNDGAAFFHFTQEANHRISNQLAVIASMVQMQASSLAHGPEMLSRTEVRGILRETAGKIASIAHLHRKLAQQDRVGHIELGEYLIECSAILASSLAPKGRVGFVQRLDKNCFVTAERAQSVGLIVNEVVTNAVKHAHPTGLPVEIRITCRHAPDQHIEIDIQDDGVGLPEGFDWQSKGGIGFRTIRALAEKLHATASIESDSLGTSFRLLVPCGTKSD
jgi:two-component sensor histidine kinase